MEHDRPKPGRTKAASKSAAKAALGPSAAGPVPAAPTAPPVLTDAVPPPPSSGHVLVELDGTQAGRRVDIPLGPPFIIGRRASADLVLADLMVSGIHGRLEALADGELRYTDFKSTNGSFVNGRRIQGSVDLPPGAVLKLGSHRFRHERIAPAGDRSLADTQPLPLTTSHSDEPQSFDLLTSLHPAEPARGAAVGCFQLADERWAVYVMQGRESVSTAEITVSWLHRAFNAGESMLVASDLLVAWQSALALDHGDPAGPPLLWCAVVDERTRTLTWAGFDAPPALLRTPDGEMHRLENSGTCASLREQLAAGAGALRVQAGTRLYAFNAGAFAVSPRGGQPWSLDDFEATIACLHAGRGPTPDEVFAALRRIDPALPHRDDFALMSLAFPES